MPWPMPRWVISSPSHITKAVPAVRVRMMSSTRATVKLGIRSMLEPLTAAEEAAAAVVEEEGQAGGLHDSASATVR